MGELGAYLTVTYLRCVYRGCPRGGFAVVVVAMVTFGDGFHARGQAWLARKDDEDRFQGHARELRAMPACRELPVGLYKLGSWSWSGSGLLGCDVVVVLVVASSRQYTTLLSDIWFPLSIRQYQVSFVTIYLATSFIAR